MNLQLALWLMFWEDLQENLKCVGLLSAPVLPI